MFMSHPEETAIMNHANIVRLERSFQAQMAYDLVRVRHPNTYSWYHAARESNERLLLLEGSIETDGEPVSPSYHWKDEGR